MTVTAHTFWPLGQRGGWVTAFLHLQLRYIYGILEQKPILIVTISCGLYCLLKV